jgi:hypothetical protein
MESLGEYGSDGVVTDGWVIDDAYEKGWMRSESAAIERIGGGAIISTDTKDDCDPLGRRDISRELTMVLDNAE